MVYSNKVVAAIKSKGKVLRENKDEVTLPFGSEYSVFIKNLHSVRIKFRVEADGNDITGGNWIIVPAHSSVELERSIKNGNFNAGNKLKFIERTAAIEEHRGVGAEDGLIRVEYFVEKILPSLNTWYNGPISFPQNSNTWNDGHIYRSFNNTGTRSGVGAASVASSESVVMAAMCAVTPQNMQSAPQNDVGITVDGGFSNQKFVSGDWFYTEPTSEVIVLKLRGVVAGKEVKQPITVEYRPECSSCGKTNRATAKFCDRCGTGLISYSR